MVDASITVFGRGHQEIDRNALVQGSTVGRQDEPNPDTEFVRIPVYNLVIDHPEGTILWDTGTHRDALDGHWPEEACQVSNPYDIREHRLDDDLEAVGYSIDDIDAVFQSHLHADHAGGLEFFDGTDVPVYVNEAELKYAYYSVKTDEGSPVYLEADFDYDLNWQILHREREQHFEDVEFVHLPGHTPGLTGTMIHLDDAGTVIFTNDQAYMSDNYRDEVPLGAGLMWSHRHWYRSLRLVQDLERRHDAQIVFGHDPEQVHEIEDGW